MKIRLSLFLLTLLTALCGRALGQDKFITLTGRVTDAATGQPVPYANINLNNAASGTSSNLAGDFVFKIAEKLSADSLLISCVGYKTLRQPVPYGGKQQMNIILQPAIILLPEVAVHARSGLDILREAIVRIPQNYDTADARLTAFYRENILLNTDTLNFNESVLDIFKTYHHDKDRQDQIRVIKGRRKNVDHSSDPQLYNWLGNIMNTAYSSLREDLQKYHGVKQSLLNERNFKYYNVDYRKTIREGDRNLLVLTMTPRKGSRKGLLNARFFIDEASKAIVKYELETTPRGAQYTNRHGKGGFSYAIMSHIVRASFDFTSVKLTVSYKYYRGKWYLGSIHRHWDLVINSKKRHIHNMPMVCDLNLLVTDVSKNDVHPFSSDVSDRNTSMNQLTGGDYDAAFWENYNILQPELPDSLKQSSADPPLPADSTEPDQNPSGASAVRVSNRENGFTRADSLRGMLGPLRSCYDVTFYHLDVEVDMDQRAIKGNNRMCFRVVTPFKAMQVDLYASMKIDSIVYQHKSLHYTREFNAVFIQLPALLPAGSEQEITLYYEGRPQTPDISIPMNGGILWDNDDLGNPWAQVVCQGSGASLWWPCKDHLSDEPDSMRIWITVPNGFTEISNGRLQGKTAIGPGKTRYEWLVSYPINNYNATFNIGKYAHFTDYYSGSGSFTIDYYVMPYNLERARNLFKQVKPMLACYEAHFGPYPFARDGFTLVESLYPMEHQSGVCIGKISGKTTMARSTMLWHESAHEWWGNAISCKDMADFWMHEGFATYAESLVLECTYGKQVAVMYLNEQKKAVKNQQPVTGVYNVNHIFYDINDMYTKGSLMLNTFRSVLNDDSLWFGLLRGIQQHFRYQTLSADDLVSYICQYTGQDYRYFFDQYLNYPHLPRLEIATKEEGSNLLLRYRWKADVSGFRMPVKVTTAADHFSFIYPETRWASMVLKNMSTADFEVDEDNFYFVVAEI